MHEEALDDLLRLDQDAITEEATPSLAEACQRSGIAPADIVAAIRGDTAAALLNAFREAVKQHLTAATGSPLAIRSSGAKTVVGSKPRRKRT
jgi:hypothetical protein